MRHPKVQLDAHGMCVYRKIALIAQLVTRKETESLRFGLQRAIASYEAFPAAFACAKAPPPKVQERAIGRGFERMGSKRKNRMLPKESFPPERPSQGFGAMV